MANGLKSDTFSAGLGFSTKMLVDLPHEIFGNRSLQLRCELSLQLNFRNVFLPRNINVWKLFCVIHQSGLLEFAKRFFFPKLVPTRAGCSLVNDSPRRRSGVNTGYE